MTTSSTVQPSLDATRVDTILNSLTAPNTRFNAIYPGENSRRQPVHSFYGGAQLFTAETTPGLGTKALDILHEYAPNGLVLGRALGLPGCDTAALHEADLLRRLEQNPEELKRQAPAAWLAHTLYRLVEEKLKREPVEDYRIDFEDGYGNRPDAEEDGHAASTARELARSMQQGTLPPYIGIRIKPFSEECKRRSVRTTDIFISELARATGGRIPDTFVVTLTKVVVPEQSAALADLLELLEKTHHLPHQCLKMEIMVEMPQSIIGRDGSSPLLQMVEACRGRCIGAHFGTYDFTAGCQITAAYQAMDHPACTFALNVLKCSLIGTGLFLSDGATNVMPVPVHKGDTLTHAEMADNARSVHQAWRLHFGHVQNSLRNGYYQGWDLHPGQLPSRYAAVYAFFLESLDGAADRLRNFVQRAAQATLLGDVFDDAATGQALLNYFLRAINCGCVTEEQTMARTGLTLDELRSRSFLAILKNRSKGQSMNPNIHEWLHLVLRWFHIIAGIMWIGDSFYFMWLDSHLTRPEPTRDQVEGELWMTHSGGFYRVEKRLIGPGQMPAVLHWFWSEATLTWVSGFFLLLVVYYAGGGTMLVSGNGPLAAPQAMALGLGLLVVGWLFYDLFWTSPLGKVVPLAGAIFIAFIAAVDYGLTQVFSGRAAFMHVGAMMGTLMVCNVWFRILPAQSRMIQATKEGRQPDLAQGKQAKLRSIHNNYMTLPVIFVMLSNHFPTLYGDKHNWLILILLFLAAVSIRFWFNHKDRMPASRFGLALGGAIVVGLVMMTMPPTVPAETSASPQPPSPSISAETPSGPGLQGTATLNGTPPAAHPIQAMAGCTHTIPDDKVLVHDGHLQNVFVWISQGLEDKTWPVPSQELVMDQKDCQYTRHVVGVQAGQKVTFVNDDNTVHNVRVESSKGDLFNTMMTSRGDKFTETFAVDPKVMLHARCDIHPWMSAYIGVVSNPFFSVTDANGHYHIDRLPPGSYTVDAWHEVFGHQSHPVTVGADGNATADFTFDASAAAGPH